MHSKAHLFNPHIIYEDILIKMCQIYSKIGYHKV